MGATISRSECDAPTPAISNPVLADALSTKSSVTAAGEESQKVNYLSLPQPIKYEELQREAYMALKFESFEGFKFDVTKALNPNFYISHRMLLASMDVPTRDAQVLKQPFSDYNYGVTVANEKMLLRGQMGASGMMTTQATWRINQHVGLKLESRMVSEPGQSQMMGDVELSGTDWNAQLKLGNGGFYGANYMQSLTPTFSVGAELFYLNKSARGGQSGVGAVARHATQKHVATAQIASTGVVACAYFHKVSEKAQVATDFLWNMNNGEATASVGYDYHFRACRLRGNIDSNGKIAAYMEERMAPSVTLVLSGELDHYKHDHKFGFGMVVGE